VDSILDHFPLPEIRQKQVKALEYTEKAYAAGFTDVVLESPTGSGKTAIAATICRWADSLRTVEDKKAELLGPGGYILVVQKVLQDQLAQDLNRFSSAGRPACLLKSSVEYECPSFKRCSVGLKKHCPCLTTNSCRYRKAKSQFLGAPVAVTNYAYFMTERQYVGDLGPRSALCCDEVHNLNRMITGHVGLSIARDSLQDYAPSLEARELDGPQTIQEFAVWIKERYVPAAKERAGILAALADEDEKAVQRAFEVEQHAMRAEGFSTRILSGDDKGWAFWREEGRRARDIQLIARPLVAGPYFNELYSGFKLRVFLSAFPGAKGTFCRELGLDPSRVAWLRLGSTFPIENRPVYLASAGSMGRKSQAETLPIALKMLLKIISKHQDRGLIHTHSYALADAVVEALRGTEHEHRIIYPKTADERTEAMATHAATEGAILISPSIYEGFDFKDDLARWSVILKAPFLSLSDKQVETRRNQDPNWYALEAVKSIVQTAGRIVRSDTDHGVVYALDSDIARLLDEYAESTPKWFLDGVIRP
jgi:Rad3-related DNA helicase